MTEDYEEQRLIGPGGTVVLRGGYGRRSVWLGLSRRRVADDDPDIVVELTPRMTLRLIAALAEMTLAGHLRLQHRAEVVEKRWADAEKRWADLRVEIEAAIRLRVKWHNESLAYAGDLMGEKSGLEVARALMAKVVRAEAEGGES